jgi:hypothetical protein
VAREKRLHITSWLTSCLANAGIRGAGGRRQRRKLIRAGVAKERALAGFPQCGGGYILFAAGLQNFRIQEQSLRILFWIMHGRITDKR